MVWIAFASLPTILVVMLAMGRLEARLLPRTPPQTPPQTPPVAAPRPRWEIVIAQADAREDPRSADLTAAPHAGSP